MPDSTPTSEAPQRRGLSPVLIVVGAIAIVGAVVAGFALGSRDSGSSSAPTLPAAPSVTANPPTEEGGRPVYDPIDAMVEASANPPKQITPKVSYATTLSVIEAAGMTAEVRALKGATILAPTDDAWNGLGADRRSALFGDPAALRSLIEHLIVTQPLQASDLRAVSDRPIDTVAGPGSVTITSTEAGGLTVLGAEILERSNEVAPGTVITDPGLALGGGSWLHPLGGVPQLAS